MATTSPINVPIVYPETPRVDTAVIIAIRRDIQPSRGWWQFELRPWHYWTAITSTLIVFVGFLVLVGIGLHR